MPFLVGRIAYWDITITYLKHSENKKTLGRSRGSTLDPIVGVYSTPPNPLAGGEGGTAPPQEPHRAFVSSGLELQPFGPRFVPPVSNF